MNWSNGGRLGVIFTRAVPSSVSSSSCSSSILRTCVSLPSSRRLLSTSLSPSPSSSSSSSFLSNSRSPTHGVVLPTTSCYLPSYWYLKARVRARSFRYHGYFRMASSLTLPKFPVFDAIAGHDPQSPAVVHCLSGRTFRYGEILPDVCRVRDRIYAAAGKSDIRGERVAFLIENSYDYVGMLCDLPASDVYS